MFAVDPLHGAFLIGWANGSRAAPLNSPGVLGVEQREFVRPLQARIGSAPGRQQRETRDWSSGS